MKKREKILAGVIVGILGMFVLGAGLKSYFTKPLQKIDRETAALRDKLNKINQERRDFFAAEDQLKAVAQRSFAVDVNQAFARSGEMITRQIALAGLSEADFTRLPAGPRKMKGASEIGWNIQGSGDLSKVVNLLYLLEKAPQVHKLENVSLRAHDKRGEVRVSFLFLTLVLEPAPDFEPVQLEPKFSLESTNRLVYSSISERDLLRPYIKVPPPARPAAPGTAPSTAPAGPETWRVVSLSEWEGQPEVHIRDAANNRTLRFKPGDVLQDKSRIVAVDYRALPMPRNPTLLSHSRVILQIGSEFWAVERGQTLAEKRKLDQDQWPQ